MNAVFDKQVQASVTDLTTRFQKLATDEAYNKAPPETPGRAAIKRGGVAAMASKFQ